jgi:hypothetical protein
MLRRVKGVRFTKGVTSALLRNGRAHDYYLVSDRTGKIVANFGKSVQTPHGYEIPVRGQGNPGDDYWVFRDEVFVAEVNLKPNEVKALILEAENKFKAKIARAVALQEQVAIIEGPKRRAIPDTIKVLVWQRDKGKCVRCGGNRLLEFDHIIPVSMGGANTARNIQLLCEGCNRTKGGSLV